MQACTFRTRQHSCTLAGMVSEDLLEPYKSRGPGHAGSCPVLGRSCTESVGGCQNQALPCLQAVTRRPSPANNALLARAPLNTQYAAHRPAAARTSRSLRGLRFVSSHHPAAPAETPPPPHAPLLIGPPLCSPAADPDLVRAESRRDRAARGQARPRRPRLWTPRNPCPQSRLGTSWTVTSSHCFG